ncbi:unnamed protein product [Caenorhabditis auriculariae]|uniref:Bestrophin homolog n=1 Tax=Caenorhabditis auriculariae TaxID=2777116 RepID=A0A8S1GY63_9PELO|nr:unnamed protein product [Caenorhabditis auriculariae]
MTVSYMQEAATANSFTFLRLLFRWRGSVWKSVAFELFVWLFIYFNFSTIYVFFLRDSKSGNIYEQVVKRCQQIVPEGRTVVTFALGFYVSHITNRWWTIFMTIPWPDTTALALCAFLRTRSKKHEVEDKAIRKSILRYMLLSFVLVFRDVSERIIKRFPTYKHLVPALMTEEERLKLERIEKVRVHWMPIEWSLSLLRRCREQGSIDEHHFCTVTRKVLDYRQMLHNILSFDWVNVPLVYVQVVNLCTMSYFFLQLLATQPILDEKQNQQVDIVPVYFIMEFIVFNGWLKTAQEQYGAQLVQGGLDESGIEDRPLGM